MPVSMSAKPGERNNKRDRKPKGTTTTRSTLYKNVMFDSSIDTWTVCFANPVHGESPKKFSRRAESEHAAAEKSDLLNRELLLKHALFFKKNPSKLPVLNFHAVDDNGGGSNGDNSNGGSDNGDNSNGGSDNGDNSNGGSDNGGSDNGDSDNGDSDNDDGSNGDSDSDGSGSDDSGDTTMDNDGVHVTTPAVPSTRFLGPLPSKVLRLDAVSSLLDSARSSTPTSRTVVSTVLGSAGLALTPSTGFDSTPLTPSVGVTSTPSVGVTSTPSTGFDPTPLASSLELDLFPTDFLFTKFPNQHAYVDQPGGTLPAAMQAITKFFDARRPGEQDFRAAIREVTSQDLGNLAEANLFLAHKFPDHLFVLQPECIRTVGDWELGFFSDSVLDQVMRSTGTMLVKRPLVDFDVMKTSHDAFLVYGILNPKYFEIPPVFGDDSRVQVEVAVVYQRVHSDYFSRIGKTAATISVDHLFDGKFFKEILSAYHYVVSE